MKLTKDDVDTYLTEEEVALARKLRRRNVMADIAGIGDVQGMDDSKIAVELLVKLAIARKRANWRIREEEGDNQ